MQILIGLRLRFLPVVVLIAMFFWGGQCFCQERTVSKVLSSWNSSAERIWSYDVVLDVEVHGWSESKRSAVKIGDYKIRQRYQLGKWRVDKLAFNEFRQDGGVSSWQTSDSDFLRYAWNGKIAKSQNSAENFASIEKKRDAFEAQIVVPLMHHAFKDRNHYQSYYEFFSSRINNSEIVSNDQATLSVLFPPVELDKIEVMVALPKSSFSLEFESANRFLPKSIIQKSGNGVVRKEIHSHYEEIDKGIWFPVQSEVKTFSTKFAPTLDEPVAFHKVRVSKTESRFNVKIGKDVFDLRPPVGTIIRDGLEETNYLQGSNEQKDYDAYAEEVLKTVRKQVAIERGSGRTRWLKLLGVVAIVLVAILFYRNFYVRQTG